MDGSVESLHAIRLIVWEWGRREQENERAEKSEKERAEKSGKEMKSTAVEVQFRCWTHYVDLHGVDSHSKSCGSLPIGEFNRTKNLISHLPTFWKSNRNYHFQYRYTDVNMFAMFLPQDVCRLTDNILKEKMWNPTNWIWWNDRMGYVT